MNEIDLARLATDYQLSFGLSVGGDDSEVGEDDSEIEQQFYMERARRIQEAARNIPADVPDLTTFLDHLRNYGNPELRKAISIAIEALELVGSIPNYRYDEFRQIVSEHPAMRGRLLAQALILLFSLPDKEKGEVFKVLSLAAKNGGAPKLYLSDWLSGNIDLLPHFLEDLKSREVKELIEGMPDSRSSLSEADTTLPQPTQTEATGKASFPLSEADSEVRLLRDLSKDNRFDQVREFLSSLNQHDGKLVWPCRYVNGRVHAYDQRFKQEALAWMMKRLFPNLDPQSLVQKTAQYFQYENGEVNPKKLIRAFWGGNDDSRVSQWIIHATGLGSTPS